MSDRARRIMSRGVAAGAASEIASGEFDDTVSTPTLEADRVVASEAMIVPHSIGNVTNAGPTAAELTALFGAPATLGRGWFAILDDEGIGARVWIIWATDTHFFYVAGTRAT